MPLFRDLNKSANDVLTKDYPHEVPLEIEIKQSSKNATFTHNVKRFDQTIEGSINAKFKLGLLPGLTGEIRYGGIMSHMFDLSYRPIDIPGLIANIRHDQKKGNIIDMGLEHQIAGSHMKFNMIQNLSKGGIAPMSWNFSICHSQLLQKCLQLRTGVELTGTAAAGDLLMIPNKYSIGAAVIGNFNDGLQWTASIKTVPNKDTMFGRIIAQIYSNRLTNGLSLAAQISHNLDDKKTGVSLGGHWESGNNNSLPFSQARLKLTQEGLISGSITHVINNRAALVIGAQICPTATGGGGAGSAGAGGSIAAGDDFKIGVKVLING